MAPAVMESGDGRRDWDSELEGITDGGLEDSETDDSNTPSESESLVEPMD